MLGKTDPLSRILFPPASKPARLSFIIYVDFAIREIWIRGWPPGRPVLSC